MRKFLASLVVLLAASFASATVINCADPRWYWVDDIKIYECEATDLRPKIRELAITGANESSLYLKTIGSFKVQNLSKLRKVPSGIAEVFENLRALWILNSGVTIVSQSDLKPLEKLEYLYLDGNKIESLDADLFLFNPLIKRLSVVSNKIKSVHDGVFAPLTGLIELNFAGNICHDEAAWSGRDKVVELTRKIYEHCKPVEDN